MKQEKIILNYIEYEGIAELTTDEQELMCCAMRAAGNGYAPYSHFHVGAAVRLADGSIVTGSNQENIAYPSGLCAERVALFTALHNHPQMSVTHLAVVGVNAEGIFVEASPCGACRQVMAEVEQSSGQKMRVLTYLDGGKIRCTEGIDSLLPFIFSTL